MPLAGLKLHGPAQASREQQRTVRFDTAEKCRKRGIEIGTIIYVAEPTLHSLHGHLHGELPQDHLNVAGDLVLNAFKRQLGLRIVDSADKVVFSNGDEITHVTGYDVPCLELHCCPTIDTERREVGAVRILELLQRHGLEEVDVVVQAGGRNDAVCGMLKGSFTKNEISALSLAVRKTFGSGYLLQLQDAMTSEVLTHWLPST